MVRELRVLGLVDGGSRRRITNPVQTAERARAERAEREKAVARARRCWAEAQPIGGTLAERYLRRRAIRCTLPATLRFHPACWHGATARRLPALIAAVERENELVGVHRTWLAEPADKADIEPQKAMLGPVGGGAVRLSDGPGALVVTEGVETGLSLVDALRAHRPRVWAALSTSGVGSLLLPPTPGELVIAPDGDEAGHKAAAKLACRARQKGWRVRLMVPPAPGRDWNDVAREVPA